MISRFKILLFTLVADRAYLDLIAHERSVSSGLTLSLVLSVPVSLSTLAPT